MTSKNNEKYTYIGHELELFSLAKNWKSYFSRCIGPYVRGRVLEVGAGQGGTTDYLWNENVSEWSCLEPDERLAKRIPKKRPSLNVHIGTLDDIVPDRKFDSILYIDVLEHIEDDAGEVQKAVSRLDKGGYLIILCPAHQFLFSPFDEKIGHFRRYTKRALTGLMPTEMTVVYEKYLDSCGLALSMANRFLLKSSQPTIKQIRFWDTTVIPLSRILDPLTLGGLGKSVVVIGQKI